MERLASRTEPWGAGGVLRPSADTVSSQAMSDIEREIASQPACWKQAVSLGAEVSGQLPAKERTVAVIGCGTSWFVGQAYASLRRGSGVGPTDAYAASEYSSGDHDYIVAISRSGTTTEVL